MDLRGKIAVVTGATSGIGRAIAVDLLRRGTVVHLLASSMIPLAPDIEVFANASKGSVHRHRVDLRDDRRVNEFLDGLAADLPSLDVLVHSAGVIRYAPIAESRIEDFDLQFQVNVRAPFLLTRRLLPLLRASGGQIVFVNSSAATRANPNTGGYTASKAALRALADCLREEVNRDGVRVISVFPGRTATPMQEAVHRWESREYRPDELLQPSDVSAAVMTALSAPRTAETTEVHIRPFQKAREPSLRSKEGQA